MHFILPSARNAALLLPLLGPGCHGIEEDSIVAAPAAAAAAANVGCERLLAGPLGDGVAWEISSAWHRRPLPFGEPERTVPPVDRSDFDGASGVVEAGWLAHESFARWLDPDAKVTPADLPRIASGALELPTSRCVAARIVPTSPRTPYVLTLRVRQPESAEPAPRLFLLDLNEDLADVRDPVAVGERLFKNKLPIVTTTRVVGVGLKKRNERDVTRYLEPEILGRDAMGFERWRVEFCSEWGARSLLLAALGSDLGGDAPPIAIDDVALHVIPARAQLGLGAGALTNFDFDLPRPWDNADARLRTTKVRIDWESRRALLLPRGASARCRLAAPKVASVVELGLAIVREERLCARGPLRETVVVEVGAEKRVCELALDAGRPSLWCDLTLPIAADPVTHDVAIEVRVAGEDDALGPLIAVGAPMVVPRPQERRDERWNVVLVSLDTMRADRLGRIVDGASITPNLDRLAQQSIVFTQALANASYTLPSHISLFTSQRPGEHGVLTVFDSFSSERSPNFAEEIARAGYLTAAFTSGGMLNAEFCGIDRGFDRFGEIDPILSPNDLLRKAAPLRDRPDYNHALADACRLDRHLLPWLGAHATTPFLLFVHTYLIHDYQPEPELAERFTQHAKPSPLRLSGPIPFVAQVREGGPDERFSFTGEPTVGAPPRKFEAARDLDRVERLYDATVFQADRDVGRLLAELDRLGLSDRTIVVVTADHGEEFLEHGDLSHARTLFDEILRVPLLIRIPGVAHRVVDAPVELIDVGPTLLARLGLAADPRMRGADLLAENWEPRDVTIHEGIEAGNAHDANGRPTTLRCARARAAKFVLQLPVDAHLDRLDLAENVMKQLIDRGYVGGGVPAGGLFDLRADARERDDLSQHDTPTPTPQSQATELLQRLMATPFVNATESSGR